MKKIWTKAATDNSISQREISHQNLARTAAAESIVLLKNDGALPVKPGSIALFGAGAAYTIKGGTGSGEVNERRSVTIWEGLKNAGFTITTEGWLKEYSEYLEKEKQSFYKVFFKKVQKAMVSGGDTMINLMAEAFHYPAGRVIRDDELTQDETCIYVISRQAGECSDRQLDKYDYSLEPCEIENIKKITAHYKKNIVVINASSSMDLNPLDKIEGISAVVFFCQQGMEGGNALADIIAGKTSPSGCLTNTWAVNYDDIPFAREYSYLKGEISKEFYKEGIYVGYRYFDSFEIPVRYEFGFGLNYSEFKIECAGVDVKKSEVTVLAKVTNSGSAHSGRKVVQAYVSFPKGILTRESISLAAFGKSKTLSPGESEELKLTFNLTELAGYDEKTSSYLLDAGDYILYLGSSSRIKQAVSVITLDETAVTERCTKVCPLVSKLEELPPSGGDRKTDISGLKKIQVKASDIPCVTHNYSNTETEHSPKVKEWMKNLTTENMMDFLLGTGFSGGKEGLTVPGSAAFTTSNYIDMGISNVALCDGPAGLRLQPVSVVKKSGNVKPVEPPMEMLKYLPGIAKKFMLGNPKSGKVIYQYTTAFPVGTAIAQTWNTEIWESYGKAVGVEMAEYGATFWLAPGMNIQRNPLCGRNFEYYSEDPLLTGKVAANVTKGLQGNEGCYVAIKHYAANNQETKRNYSDSVVSERALREIYLKGFKIAVQEGGAKSVMTSYNLLNGTYAPNSYDLCVKLLRNEWGFKGLVMTDWLSTGKGLASNGLAIKNGNDLLMPGGNAFMKRLKEDFENGVFTEEDIKRCCANILELIAESRIQKEFEKSRT